MKQRGGTSNKDPELIELQGTWLLVLVLVHPSSVPVFMGFLHSAALVNDDPGRSLSSALISTTPQQQQNCNQPVERIPQL